MRRAGSGGTLWIICRPLPSCIAGHPSGSFIAASAEAPRDGRVNEATRAYRREIRDLFTELATAAGASDPALLASQLQLLYDGGSTAAPSLVVLQGSSTDYHVTTQMTGLGLEANLSWVCRRISPGSAMSSETAIQTPRRHPRQSTSFRRIRSTIPF